MKLGTLAGIGGIAAALLLASSANAATFVANSSNSGGLLTGSTALIISTVSTQEFTFEIKNATSTWTGATQLDSFAFNNNIIGTAGTLSATETSPVSATGTFHSGGLNSGGCNGSGAFFCFSWGPASVSSDMVFDIKTTGAFNYSSTNLPDLKIMFEDVHGDKVGTLFSADIPFCSSNCPTPTPRGGVPEPASWAMMLVGVGAIGGSLRMRRKTLAAA